MGRLRAHKVSEFINYITTELGMAMRRTTYKQRAVSTVLLATYVALFHGYTCGGLGRSWLLLSRLGCWLSGFTVEFSAGGEFRPVSAFSLQAKAQAMLNLCMNYTCTYLGETILHVWLQSGEAPVLLR